MLISDSDPKSVARRFVTEVQGARRTDLVPELFSDSFVNHSAIPGLPAGRDGISRVIDYLWDTFADFTVTIDDMIAEGRQVVVRKTMRGKLTGTWAGRAGQGEQVEFGVIEILAVEDGKITAHWGASTALSFPEEQDG